jgi:hypothetical protein
MNHGVRQHFYCIECATYLKRSQVCGWNFELRRIDPGIFLLSQRNPLTRKHRSLVSHEAACRLPIAFNMFTSEGNTIWWPKFLLEGSRWCGVPASASPASSMQRLPFQERLVLPVEARPAIHPFASDGRPPAICGAAVACIRCSRFMRLFPDVARPATWHTLPTGKLGRELTIAQGADAARLTGLCCLSTLRTYLGDLDQVSRVVRVLGFINARRASTGHLRCSMGFPIS